MAEPTNGSIVRDGEPAYLKTAASPASKKRLKREAAVLSVLSHPAVVEMLEFDASGVTPTLCTNFAGRQTIDDRPPQSLSSLISSAVALLDSIKEIHELGWCHFNLDPSHCIAGGRGRIVFCSWGYAEPVEKVGDGGIRKDYAALGRILNPLVEALPNEQVIRTVGYRRKLATVARIFEDLSRGPDTRAAIRLRGELLSLESDSKSNDADRGGSLRIAAKARKRQRRLSAARAILAVLPIAAALWFLLMGPTVSPDEPILGWLVLGLRVLAVGACLYLLLGVFLALAALATRRDDLATTTAKLAPPQLRRFAAFVIGAGVLSSVAPGLNTAPKDNVVAEAPVIPIELDEPSTSFQSTSSPSRKVSHSSSPKAELKVSAPIEEQGSTKAAVSWEVGPGDHLWAIAETTLTERGVLADDNAIAKYWLSLIRANKHNFIDPDNPDLLYAGQVVELP